jgi:hypothetical protein
MDCDYVYVKKSHRVLNPQLVDYMNLSRYLRMMCDLHGLYHDPLAPFEISSIYNCFRVIDKGKAMLFCLNNGDQIIKPEKTTNDLLNFQ